MALEVQVTGLKELKRFSSDTEEVVNKALAELLEVQAAESVAEAKRLAPVDVGDLRRGITATRINKLHWKVVSYAKHTPYVEFGTGGRVRVPPELAEVAAQFKGKGGNFNEGLEKIRQWLRRQGGDPNNAFIVFMSILRRGLRPRPFIYPAYKKAKRQLQKDVNDEMERIAKTL